MAMGIHDGLLPFINEKSITSYDKMVEIIFSSKSPPLIHSLVDILLKYKISGRHPSKKTITILLSFVHQCELPICILFYKNLITISSEVLPNIDTTFHIDDSSILTEDELCEIKSRNAILLDTNNDDLNLLFTQTCVYLNLGEYLKAIRNLHLIILNKKYLIEKDPLCDLFIKQSIGFIKEISQIKLSNNLIWELTLFNYAKKRRGNSQRF